MKEVAGVAAVETEVDGNCPILERTEPGGPAVGRSGRAMTRLWTG
jgi:hypothetical protein